MQSTSFISYSRIVPVVALAALILVSAAGTDAQSSLFNIPTADTLSKGERYFEIDFDAHFTPLCEGGWQSYGAMGVFGIGNRAEAGVNVATTRFDGGTSVELQPNFKFKAFENESMGVTVSVGAIGYVPVKGGRLRDTQVSTYVVAAKSFQNSWAPRFTAGGYQLVGSDPDGAARRGFLLGIQQPVHKRVELVADWNTAKNRFGYAAAGVGVTLTKRSYLYSAYYFGNQARANNSFGIYYGFSF